MRTHLWNSGAKERDIADICRLSLHRPSIRKAREQRGQNQKPQTMSFRFAAGKFRSTSATRGIENEAPKKGLSERSRVLNEDKQRE